jgi:propionyl-CoA carboxylase beta chain
MQDHIDRLRALKAEAAGSASDAEAQHKRGRLTARERIDLLFDPGSFSEIDTLVTTRYESFMGGKSSRLGDGVITGFGLVQGRQVFAAAQDATVMGGSLGEMHASKIVKAMNMALSYGCPFVALNDSGGARIQEGVDSLGGYGRIFDANCESSGVIPQLSVILGPCAGGAVYSPGLTDFIFMTENSYMFITGPEVVRSVMQENVSQEELGGGRIHATESGVAHFLSSDDRECLLKVRELLSYLPSNNLSDPPYIAPRDDPERRCPELEQLVPVDPHKPYDVRTVIASIVDDGRFFEVHELWAQNLVTGFARLDGYVVGIVANQPMTLAGTIDIKASLKATHMLRICDAYNIPIITLQDVPGFLPGTSQEYGGIIRNGARLIYAYSEATVPKLMLILRKSYGGASCVMSSKGLRGDLIYAWPNAELAVMGAAGAVNILFRNEVKAAADPQARSAELVSDYQQKFNNPYVVAARGLIDDVIEPRDSRRVLIRALHVSLTKRERHVPKKHGISPM